MSSTKLTEIYNLLLDRYGPQNWWPGDTPFEVIVGAILTQNTNWANVEKAIKNLKAADALTPEKLSDMDTDSLAALIRPAGYYNIKAARLKNFLNWLKTNFNNDLDTLTQIDTYSLRQQLLSIKGIGLETCDSILLYALDKPIFVIDAYTCRIMTRHELIEPGADYEYIREFFESSLEQNTNLFNEYHALIVRLGKEHCRPKARCTDCPLRHLPHEIQPQF